MSDGSLFNVNEIANRISVSPSTVFNMCRRFNIAPYSVEKLSNGRKRYIFSNDQLKRLSIEISNKLRLNGLVPCSICKKYVNRKELISYTCYDCYCLKVANNVAHRTNQMKYSYSADLLIKLKEACDYLLNKNR